MSCETIKYKVLQSPETKNLTLQIYRPFGEKNEWVMVDHFNEMTAAELKYLCEYVSSLFKKAK